MKNLTKLYCLISAFILSSPMVFAADLSERIDNASRSVQSTGNLMTIVVGVAGIILLFMGIMGLKKYADDSRQNPLMKPMIYLIAGAVMSGFTTFRNILSTTTTGANADGSLGKSDFNPKSSGSSNNNSSGG